jgi:phosphoglycerate dehydrogenase-like enzyme
MKESAVKVLIPDSIRLSFAQTKSQIEFIPYSVTSTDFSSVQDAELLVLWMNSSENLHAAVSQLHNLKLIQTLAAGPDHALNAGFPGSVAIASGRSLHDKTVTEHALALLLHAVRNLDQLRESQNNSYWTSAMLKRKQIPRLNLTTRSMVERC